MSTGGITFTLFNFLPLLFSYILILLQPTNYTRHTYTICPFHSLSFLTALKPISRFNTPSPRPVLLPLEFRCWFSYPSLIFFPPLNIPSISSWVFIRCWNGRGWVWSTRIFACIFCSLHVRI
ncbi:uncharacterized protein TERG_12392 [Trichophyton rubrum CBS 118892]|uniref:Uncharacterized protein n=1 Tax=Trichophyton rubrum (strain ATCC MYA-4607 / CBS 118892) TaxID=559305 RepID=A0A080WW01_TRIRC|nr:uncharacterized protein TERG_12392 [Trichophyton rubrum CBS 118892]KFL62233.1 hypothetical protein TERG_12392 [Trichophyton rubrum CBS 118892]